MKTFDFIVLQSNSAKIKYSCLVFALLLKVCIVSEAVSGVSCDRTVVFVCTKG